MNDFRRAFTGFIASSAVAMPAFLGLRWIIELLKTWGHRPYQWPGLLMGLGLVFTLIVSLLFVDFLLSRAGLNVVVRSALWVSSAFGPYAGLVAFEETGRLWLAQFAGIAVTILAFLLAFWYERGRMGKAGQP